MSNEPTVEPHHRALAPARYLSCSDTATILGLLVELRDRTQSRGTHMRATRMIIELAGTDLVAPARFGIDS